MDAALSRAENPTERAERLLRDVLGEEQFHRLRTIGYLDLPSEKVRGRIYRLDSLGNLSYRDAGEAGFNTGLCVQPEEAIPRDDQIAMRYLLVTADEERLLETANPITFGFISLIRALFHDFSQRHAAWLAGLLTAAVVLFFLGSLGVEVWLVRSLFPQNFWLAALLGIVFIVPALVGLVLVVAGAVELVRWVRTSMARGRLRA